MKDWQWIIAGLMLFAWAIYCLFWVWPRAMWRERGWSNKDD